VLKATQILFKAFLLDWAVWTWLEKVESLEDVVSEWVPFVDALQRRTRPILTSLQFPVQLS
jgi:hypothetical protein